MNRELALRQMSSELFDLIVIGGGITGCGIAREAALRGLKVALLERHDFAYGTSSRSTKLIHGGLRYLKQFDFKLVRESVQERQLLINMAPHLVKVQQFLFPVYKGDPDRLFMLRIGLTLYDWFAGRSNQIPHRIIGPGPLQRLEPAVRANALTGGGLYNDCTTNDGRLTLAVLQSAVAHGAKAANYCEVTGYLYDDTGRISGVRARDELTGQPLEIIGERVLAAAGPWADHLRQLDDPTALDLLRCTKGVHITVSHDRLPLRNAVVMRGPDTRMMFAIPAGDLTYLGTTDTDHDGDVEAAAVERSDVAYILSAANHAFPERRLTPSDVVSTWVGLRPLIKPALDKSPSAVSRDYALYHSNSGLVTVAGGKLTAFRAMASHILDESIPTSAGAQHLAASTAVLPGADGPIASTAEIAALAMRTRAPLALVARLASEYGSRFAMIAEELNPGDAPELAWLRAQTRHAVKREMARRLEDVVGRRTGALLFSRDNGATHLADLAAEMAGLLGWSTERQVEEIGRCQALIANMFRWRD